MKVAFVGTGGIAQRHLRVLAEMADVELVGHVSQTMSRAEEQAKRYGGRAFSRLIELLDTAAPEAVWVCVTPDRHGPLELALIDAGVPFFVEKPLSVDLETAERVGQRLAASLLVTAVGYKFRALDTLTRARHVLTEFPPRMVLATWHDRMPAPVWWRHASLSGGQIVEQTTHLLDLARILVGEASVVSGLERRWPRADVADSDIADVSTALLRFATADGSVPGIVSVTCLLRGAQAIQLQLVCEGRVITLSERALIIDTGRERQEYLTSVDPFRVEDVAFLEAVRAGQPSAVLCSYAEALQTHRLACTVRDIFSSSAVDSA